MGTLTPDMMQKTYNADNVTQEQYAAVPNKEHEPT